MGVTWQPSFLWSILVTALLVLMGSMATDLLMVHPGNSFALLKNLCFFRLTVELYVSYSYLTNNDILGYLNYFTL